MWPANNLPYFTVHTQKLLLEGDKSLWCKAGLELAVHQLCCRNTACSCLKKHKVTLNLRNRVIFFLCVMMWGLESCLRAHLVMMAVWSLTIHLWCPLVSCSIAWCDAVVLLFTLMVLVQILRWKFPDIRLDLDCCLKLIFQCLILVSIHC